MLHMYWHFKLNLRGVVKQPLSQVREHVVQVFPIAVLNDSTGGFDDRDSYPRVLVSNCLHERPDQTLSLHVEVLWGETCDMNLRLDGTVTAELGDTLNTHFQ